MQTTEDFLAHYGVLGMKWGQSKEKKAPKGSKALSDEKTPFKNLSVGEKQALKTHKYTNNQIVNARARQKARLQRGDYLYKQVNGRKSTLTASGKTEANRILTNLESTYTLGADARTAERMTAGEKASTGILLGVSGLMLLSSVSKLIPLKPLGILS